MTNNYIQPGSVIDWTNDGADVASGDPVIIGSNGDGVVAVAQVHIASGATGSVATRGVFELPKVDAAVIAAGEYVLFDSSVGAFDDNAATAASGDVADGAWAIESKGATTGAVIKLSLTGKPGVLS